MSAPWISADLGIGLVGIDPAEVKLFPDKPFSVRFEGDAFGSAGEMVIVMLTSYLGPNESDRLAE